LNKKFEFIENIEIFNSKNLEKNENIKKKMEIGNRKAIRMEVAR
jgi:hypothetical protein